MDLDLHQETVTFDRVFDIVRSGQGDDNEPSTLFSFQSGSRYEYGVAVPGEPEISDGMTVTVILGRAGNWQTLMGWVNHATGELTCKANKMLAIFVAIPFVIAAIALIKTHAFAGGAMLLFFILLLLGAAWEAYRVDQARTKLEVLVNQTLNMRK
jgi:cation transport ATPase